MKPHLLLDVIIICFFDDSVGKFQMFYSFFEMWMSEAKEICNEVPQSQ